MEPESVEPASSTPASVPASVPSSVPASVPASGEAGTPASDALNGAQTASRRSPCSCTPSQLERHVAESVSMGASLPARSRVRVSGATAFHAGSVKATRSMVYVSTAASVMGRSWKTKSAKQSTTRAARTVVEPFARTTPPHTFGSTSPVPHPKPSSIVDARTRRPVTGAAAVVVVVVVARRLSHPAARTSAVMGRARENGRMVVRLVQRAASEKRHRLRSRASRPRRERPSDVCERHRPSQFGPRSRPSISGFPW